MMLPSGPATKIVFLSCGANVAGTWGSPAATLAAVPAQLGRIGVRVLACSRFYRTTALGSVRQPAYLNIVLAVRSEQPASRLLRSLKALERNAGRRTGIRWGPRPLDIDIIDFPLARTRWLSQGRRRAGQLILPHPEAHQRAFVLVPLLEVAPHWRHPILDRSARQLLERLGPRHARSVVPVETCA